MGKPISLPLESKSTQRATAYFIKMFEVHNTIKYMKESIDKLYATASYISPSFDSVIKTQSNPQKLSDAVIKAADLKNDCKNLLNERAEFDKFVFRLSKTERKVLVLRCEKNKSWKEIASDLDISRSSVERTYRKVCLLAEQQLSFDV